jgi:hypothetical protein
MSTAITIGEEEIMTESEKADLLQHALDEFDAWRKRYADFPEFRPLIEAIDETILRHGEIRDDSIESK